MNRIRILVAMSVMAFATVLFPVKMGNSDKPKLMTVAKMDDKKLINLMILPEQTKWNVPLSLDFQRYIHELCMQYNVDEKMAYAIMKTESNFNALTVSSEGDYGLFQINRINFPMLQQEIGFENPIDPYQNAKAGIYMLSKLQKEFHNQNEVLIAYNQGVNGARRLISRGVELTDYTIKVKNNMNTIHKIGDSYEEEKRARESIKTRMVEIW
jgi:soluble lytic murein transglycosylase-like protein